MRNIADQLWQILSEELGEDIDKYNFLSTFNRLNISSSQNQHICHVSGNYHNFNYSPSILYNSNQDNPEDTTNSKSNLLYIDLTLAPQILHFCSRDSELQTLESWIFDRKTRLISVLGLSGIGKTTLVKRFVDRTLDRFEVIIWRNLKFPESLDSLVNDILQVCHQEPKDTINDRLKQLFALFAEKQCLIILDDVQNLFVSGEFAGQYQPEYQDYQKSKKSPNLTIKVI